MSTKKRKLNLSNKADKETNPVLKMGILLK